MITDLCVLVYGVVSTSPILINKKYVLWICILNIDDPFTVLVVVLVFEPQVLVLEPQVLVLDPQVLDNNTAYPTPDSGIT